MGGADWAGRETVTAKDNHAVFVYRPASFKTKPENASDITRASLLAAYPQYSWNLITCRFWSRKMHALGGHSSWSRYWLYNDLWAYQPEAGREGWNRWNMHFFPQRSARSQELTLSSRIGCNIGISVTEDSDFRLQNHVRLWLRSHSIYLLKQVNLKYLILFHWNPFWFFWMIITIHLHPIRHWVTFFWIFLFVHSQLELIHPTLSTIKK